MGSPTCTTPPDRDVAAARRAHRLLSRLTVRGALPGLMRLLLALTLALPAGLLVEGVRPALAAAGDLDPTFGSGGILRAGFGESIFRALAIQPDGKLVAGVGAHGIALARYNPDGSLDPGFGTGGKAMTDLDVAAIAFQADGKIVTAGAVGSTTVTSLLLARFNPDGSLDSGFGAGGKVIADAQPGFLFPLTAFTPHLLAMQSDGKIVVGGWFRSAWNATRDFGLVRYNPNGSLDGSFGAGGMAIADVIGGDDELRAVALQADGKIIAAGRVSSGPLVASAVGLTRFNPNGSLDTSFGSGGKVITDYGPPTPGQGGFPPVFPIDQDAGNAVVVQRDGKIVVAGGAANRDHSGLAVTRYNPNGSPDTSFGTGGTLFASTGFAARGSLAAVIQPSGKIVVAVGGPGSFGVFALARINPNGSPDASFGTGGLVTTSILGDIRGLALQPDGKVVTAGGTGSTGNPSDGFVLARFLDDSVGGLAFGISPQPSSIALGWVPGSGQTGYLLARAPSASWPLPSGATSHVDSTPAPAPNPNCYQLLPLVNSSVLAASDALCAQLGVRSQIGPPPGFALRLDQSTTARLTWGSPGDHLGYVLLALPAGGAPRTLGLAASARWATDQTGGTPTCYVLYAVYPAGTGNTDAACAVPGRAHFGTMGPAAQGAAAAGPQATRAAAAPLAEQKLDRQVTDGRKMVEQEAGRLRRKGR